MADTIMGGGGRDTGHQSVLNVDRDVLHTIVNEKNVFSADIIDISSDDESEDGEHDDYEPNSDQPRVNTAKLLSQPLTARDYIPFVQGVLVKQDRVQDGRITKPRACHSKNTSGDSIAERVASRRRPFQSREEYRQQQQHAAHVPIPQDRATRSGPGRIRQFDPPSFIDRLYSAKSLDSKVAGLPRHRYAYVQGQRNLPCLPFVLQITILRSLQMALESMCYRFVEKWLPKVLDANEWDCPDAIELSCWWRALEKCQIPIEAISPGRHRPLGTLFGRVKDIRHFAVHRLPDIPINSIQEMVTDTLDIAKMFGDDSHLLKLNLWKEKLEYFSKVMLAAHGNLDTTRKLDAINSLKESNANDQSKLNQEIVALEMEIQAKKQQIDNLQEEYRGHCKNESEIINEDGGGIAVQGAEKCSRSLGTLKWLEECFTLNLDRDAPNAREEANLSGQLIELKNVGFKPLPPARSNIGGGENTFHADVHIVASQQNGLLFPDTGPRLDLSGIPGLGRRAFSVPPLRSHVRQAIPSNAVIFDLTGDDDDDDDDDSDAMVA
ncbi:hypothetical protein DSL72_001946 [Monilinia vaccinii-corymbosi]|uniref:Uncharacterized protein n=1 Tax=Monilinia vaccinii-corymbosi TaxID=61207 RepID=A0A8A3PB84_9HELO|nr:hypothetical protein DSL72_001946 [Monilinia vaccinii-corymbosi]